MTLIKVKTLFLDDDDNLKTVMEITFALRNFVDYEWYRESNDLLENLTDETQVVVIDYMLSEHDLDGISVIKKVKEINPVCYCILMSNQNTKKVIIDAYDSGCDKYIDKSDINYVDQLFAEIEKGIEKVNIEFESHVAILTRMKESIKIFNEIKQKAN